MEKKEEKRTEESFATLWFSEREEDFAEFKVEPTKFRAFLRRPLTFAFLKPVYTCVTVHEDKETGELEDVSIEWRLFQGFLDPKAEPMLIVDTDGVLNERKLKLCLRRADEDTRKKVEEGLPKNLKKRLRGERSFELWVPIEQLRDPRIVKEVDWPKLVDHLINPGGAVEYQKLLAVRRCHLLRGVKQACNPHAIIVTPAQTGRSEWYEIIGTRVDKPSARSMIGYADQNGVHPGTLHGLEEPYCIDQIEEVTVVEVLRFLLHLMEKGVALVDNAAIPFQIWSKATIIIVSNPIGDPKADFMLILKHLCKNPAAGRRFGILLYDYDYGEYQVPRVKKREKDLSALMKDNLALFRAVEEFSRKRIRKIVEDSWDWINQKNDEWIQQAMELISTIDKEETRGLHAFLANYIQLGGSHLRGGALYAAIAETLDEIALESYNLQDILRRADEHLTELLDLSYQSLKNILQAFEERQEDLARRIFDILPEYLKEITSAVELAKDHLKSVPVTVPARKLPYQPEKFRYFSEVLNFARKGNPQRFNERLEESFGYRILKNSETGEIELEILTKERRLQKPLGKFRKSGNLETFSGEKERASGEKTIPREEFQNSKLPKIPKRYVCPTCKRQLEEKGELLKVLGRTEGGICELCGEGVALYVVQIRGDERG